MRLPDFLIAGAPRSGTTWLYHVLSRHPEVYLARPVAPEPKFFLVDAVYNQGIDFYARQWFAEVPAGKAAGEKSTNYLESATAAARIAQHLPRVKLVFALRNPVERAYSNYLWSRQNGLEAEEFATALALEEQREGTVPAALRFARPHAYFSRGLYADLLWPYLERFGRDQILCLRYEDLGERPAELAVRLHRFLGVAERPGDVEGLGVVNASEPAAAPLAPRLRAELAARYNEPNRRLAALLQDDFRPWL